MPEIKGISIDRAVEHALKRDRFVVLAALLGIVVLSWAYILAGAGMDMMTPAVWTPAYASAMFVMWWVMMVAMMLPLGRPDGVAVCNYEPQAKGTRTSICADSTLRVGLPGRLGWFQRRGRRLAMDSGGNDLAVTHAGQRKRPTWQRAIASGRHLSTNTPETGMPDALPVPTTVYSGPLA